MKHQDLLDKVNALNASLHAAGGPFAPFSSHPLVEAMNQNSATLKTKHSCIDELGKLPGIIQTKKNRAASSRATTDEIKKAR